MDLWRFSRSLIAAVDVLRFSAVAVVASWPSAVGLPPNFLSLCSVLSRGGEACAPIGQKPWRLATARDLDVVDDALLVSLRSYGCGVVVQAVVCNAYWWIGGGPVINRNRRHVEQEFGARRVNRVPVRVDRRTPAHQCAPRVGGQRHIDSRQATSKGTRRLRRRIECCAWPRGADAPVATVGNRSAAGDAEGAPRPRRRKNCRRSGLEPPMREHK